MLEVRGYTIKEQIHRSENVEVYRARRADDLSVILKASRDRPTPGVLMNDLQLEYGFLRSLHGEGIPHAVEMLQIPRQFVLVMEDTGGVALRDILKKRRIAIDIFLKIALRLISILESLHGGNLLHLNIHPGNIIWNVQTGSIQLIDFKTAQWAARSMNRGQKEDYYFQTNRFRPEYMAPEQTGRIEYQVDYRTDFYSLGVTFFEILLGFPPFQSENPLDLIDMQINAPPPEASSINREIPALISAIIQKLMAKRKNERYQSLHGIKSDLETCIIKWNEGTIHSPVPLALNDRLHQFHSSDRLFGREKQLGALMQCHDTVCSGNSRTVLISGPSGSGKSAFLDTITRKFKTLNSFIIKYDFKSNFEELEDFIATILKDISLRLSTEPDHRLNTVLERMKSRSDTRFFEEISLFPFFSRIHPDSEIAAENLPVIPSIDLLKNISSALGEEDRPFILVLDDFPWKTNAFAKAIDSLITEPGIDHLLLVIASNESSKSFSTMEDGSIAEDIDSAPVPLFMDPLDSADIEKLLHDSFRCNRNRVSVLAKFLFERTKGSPLFIKQYLQDLYENRLLQFNPKFGEWIWDMDVIQRYCGAESILALILKKVDTLEKDLKVVARYAACMGETFKPGIIASLLDLSVSEVIRRINRLISEGLVSEKAEENGSAPSQEFEYAFNHKRILQAIYDSLNEGDKKEIHLRTARNLYSQYSNDEGNALKEITLHFNRAHDLLSDPAERDMLLTWNLQLARHFFENQTYEKASYFCEMAMKLLPIHAWYSRKATVIELHLLQAEIFRKLKLPDEMDALINDVLEESDNIQDRIRAISIRISHLKDINDFHSAFQSYLMILNILDLTIPHEVSPRILHQLSMESKSWLNDNTLNDLLAGHVCEDESIVSMLHVLSEATLIAFTISSSIYQVLIHKAIHLSMEYGISPPGTTMVMRLLANLMDDPAQKSKSLELAEKIIQFYAAENEESAFAHFIYLNVAYHKERDINKMSSRFYQISRSSLQRGWSDLTLLSLIRGIACSIISGESLYRVLERNHELKTPDVLNGYGITATPLSFVHDMLESLSRSGLSRHIPVDAGAERVAIARFYEHFWKGFLLFHFAEYEAASQEWMQIEKSQFFKIFRLEAATYYYYLYILNSILAFFTPGSHSEEQKEKFDAIYSHFQKYSESESSLNDHRETLLQALKAVMENRDESAMILLDRSIHQARENGNHCETAISCYQAARYYHNKGITRCSIAYLEDAIKAYKLWGASPVIEHLSKWLESLYKKDNTIDSHGGDFSFELPELFEEKSVAMLTADLATLIDSFDTQTSPPGTSIPLLRVLRQFSGARFLAVYINRNESWYLENCASFDEGNQELLAVPMEKSFSIYSITHKDAVLSAIRMKQVVRSSDADQSHPVVHQPEQTKENLKGFAFAIPILHRNYVKGVVYIQNASNPGVYSENRFGIVRALCEKIVESILKTGKNRPVSTDLTNPRISPKRQEVTILYSDMRDFRIISESLSPEDTFHLISEYISAVEPEIYRFGGSIEKMVGDAIIAAFPVSSEHAIQAAIGVLLALKKYNKHHKMRRIESIKAGAGIHIDDMIFGAIKDSQATYITDAVKIAGRIERITKLFNIPLAISGTAFFRSDIHRKYSRRFLGLMEVDTSSPGLPLFEILDASPDDLRRKKEKTSALLEESIYHYLALEFDSALAGFQKILKQYPEDGVANFYLKKCNAHRLNAKSRYEIKTTVYPGQ